MPPAWRMAWVKHPSPLTEQIKSALYHHTQGIPALVIKLLFEAQLYAINRTKKGQQETVDETVLEQVFNRMRLTKPVMDVLRALEEEKKNKLSGLLPQAGSYDDLKDPIEYLQAPNDIALNDWYAEAIQKIKEIIEAKISADTTEGKVAYSPKTSKAPKNGRGKKNDETTSTENEGADENFPILVSLRNFCLQRDYGHHQKYLGVRL